MAHVVKLSVENNAEYNDPQEGNEQREDYKYAELVALLTPSFGHTFVPAVLAPYFEGLSFKALINEFFSPGSSIKGKLISYLV